MPRKYIPAQRMTHEKGHRRCAFSFSRDFRPAESLRPDGQGELISTCPMLGGGLETCPHLKRLRALTVRR